MKHYLVLWKYEDDGALAWESEGDWRSYDSIIQARSVAEKKREIRTMEYAHIFVSYPLYRTTMHVLWACSVFSFVFGLFLGLAY